MKYKNKVAYLVGKQKWWDRQDDNFKRSTTRPGSVKTS